MSIYRIFIASFVLLWALAGRNQPVVAAELVMFESIGCTWCERWHSEVGVIYKNTPEGAALPLRLVDIDDDLPKDLDNVKGIFYTPTFLIMDGKKELGRIRGYPGEDFFWPMLAEYITRYNLAAKQRDTVATSAPAMAGCTTDLC